MNYSRRPSALLTATVVVAFLVLISNAQAGVDYDDPAGGWRYTYEGDFIAAVEDPNCDGGVCPPGYGDSNDKGGLDGTWSHINQITGTARDQGIHFLFLEILWEQSVQPWEALRVLHRAVRRQLLKAAPNSFEFRTQAMPRRMAGARIRGLVPVLVILLT